MIRDAIPLFQFSFGSPSPLGAHLLTNNEGIQTWNFAVFAPDAKAMRLCLYRPDTEELIGEFSFNAKTADIWHLSLSGIEDGTLYAFKAEGDYKPEAGLMFDDKRVLLDPYVKKLNRSLGYNDALYAQKSPYMIAKGVLCADSFDWQQSKKPCIAREKTIIYEAHVKGLTMLHPDVPAHLRGTYLGLCQPVIVNHLKSLGITTLQLLPVAAFMPEPRLVAQNLTNYWGYNPVCFFVPEPRYQYRDAISEFKTLVRTYHQAGIEIILDVVFNHSAEGGLDGPTLNFRGLANKDYYVFEQSEQGIDYLTPANYTGCGNTINVAHPNVQQLILDALRYWATDMQVDGFRFDLATTLARENRQFNKNATFLQIVAQDPVLCNVKLIAEPWDIGPFGYQLGQFPPNWSELNDQSRDTFRAFIKGDSATLAQFATRLLGSRDIFLKNQKSVACSVNYVTYHDGFTLEDVVSYNQKHNELNAEQNQDGHNHNLSVNHGVEGKTTDEHIRAKRFLHKRNLVTTLLLSQGIPHWLGGDELSHSQQGNNNAYCQDNEISWLNWHLEADEQEFLAFVKQMFAFRRRYPCFTQMRLEDDNYQIHGDKYRIEWYLADGRVKQPHDWDNPALLNCIVTITKQSAKDGKPESLLLIFNASSQVIDIQLPNKSWQLLFDTSVNVGFFTTSLANYSHYQQGASSISVWL